MSQNPPVDKITRRRRFIRSFEGKSLRGRRFTEKVADQITATFGSFTFAVLHIYWFLLWILINNNLIPGIHPFDPFPYGLLTMIVSLEAIFLSIFVLLSQNRASQVANLREELLLQVDLIAEEEITKVLELLSEIRTKMGIKREDPELARMLERIDTSYIESSLQRQIDAGSTNILKAITPNNFTIGDKSQSGNEGKK
ncbi:MAG: DUF1003 domain-containing protein [Candidatus Levybacteria bacterium]|nr:DUF1003 domain-containing protein [Candidatus Levybacteria bacterium]